MHTSAPSPLGGTSGARPGPTLDALTDEIQQMARQGRLTPDAARESVHAYIGDRPMSAISLMVRLTRRAWVAADFRLEADAFAQRAGDHLVVAQLARETLVPGYRAPEMRATSAAALQAGMAHWDTALGSSRAAPAMSPAAGPRPTPPAQGSVPVATASDRDLARRMHQRETQQINDTQAFIDALLAGERERVRQYQDETQAILDQLSPEERDINRPQGGRQA